VFLAGCLGIWISREYTVELSLFLICSLLHCRLYSTRFLLVDPHVCWFYHVLSPPVLYTHFCETYPYVASPRTISVLTGFQDAEAGLLEALLRWVWVEL